MLIRLLFLGLMSALTLSASEPPAYLTAALTRFSAEIPPYFAYTLTTQRGTDISVERFDPSRPVETQWTLLERNQRPATPEENARYSSYRISTGPSARATFKRGDLDLPSLTLMSETDDQAEFRGRFREDLADPMLHHLQIVLTVAKRPAAIKRYVLQLTEPYSPVLTVKMLELRVETLLLPPTDDSTTLPLRTISRFRGRVLLLKSMEEDIQTDYSDFVRVTPLPMDQSQTNPKQPNELPKVD